MADDLSIRELNDAVLKGTIRAPAFQRGFVWDADRVAMLMDSLHKGYPIGSVLLWRTRSALRTERRLGPFELPERDPDFPIDYVLDRQQRLTSVFGVFQTTLEPQDDYDWIPIYFDIRSNADPQDSQFLALSDEEVDTNRHFPLNLDFDSTAYRRGTENFDDETKALVDNMTDRFKELRLQVDDFQTEVHEHVAIVFERVNRLGVELDTLQLLSAWTWSEDFDLQETFSSLADELEPFGFSGVGEDSTLLLRCRAAVVAGDASPQMLVKLNGTEVRNRFSEVRNGIRGAIDFLRSNLQIHSIGSLPFSTLLVPLAAFFATPDSTGVKLTSEQRETLLHWFWRASFSRRYSSGVLRNLNSDIEAAKKLRSEGSSTLGTFASSITPEFFLNSRFSIGTVNSKTLIAVLAQEKPLSFVSGQPVQLDKVPLHYNRREFHHCYPRDYLNRMGVQPSRRDSLANFAFISAGDNKILGGESPATYKVKMPANSTDEIIRRALLPSCFFADDFDTFITERAELLAARARELAGITDAT